MQIVQEPPQSESPVHSTGALEGDVEGADEGALVVGMGVGQGAKSTLQVSEIVVPLQLSPFPSHSLPSGHGLSVFLVQKYSVTDHVQS